MSILFLILPLAIGIVGVAVAAFVWAVRHGQYDDTQTPAIRVLHEEDDEPRDA